LEDGPRIADYVPQGVPSHQSFEPGGAVEPVSLLGQNDGHALRLNAHEDGMTVEEDLVETGGHNELLAPLVEVMEDLAGSKGGGLDPAVDSGPARSGLDA
jgi:hypothetical protein